MDTNRIRLFAIANVCFLAVVLCHGAATDALSSDKWIRHAIDNSSLGADGVRTADVNGDGLPDLIAGWEQGGVSRIYVMHRKAGEIPTWIQINAGPAPSVEDALLVDLDQDGAMDVVSSTEGNHKKILVHWAPPPGADYTDSKLWTTETLFEDGSRWMFAVTMDIDGQHGPDLIIGGKGENASIGWLESPKNPRMASHWRFHSLTSVTWVMSIIRTDIDGDGLTDILASERKGKQEGVFWLKNPGKNHATLREPWLKVWIADDLHESNFIDIYDFDGDGSDEIIVPHKQGESLGLISIIEHEKGHFRKRHSVNIPSSITKPKAVQAADINQDGRVDLVLSTEAAFGNQSGIIWLEYLDTWTKPEWKAHDVSGPDGIKFDLNLLLDVDADGDLDIVNTEEANNAQGGKAGLGLVWYENPHIQ